MMPLKQNIYMRVTGTLLAVAIIYFLLDSLSTNLHRLSELQYTINYPRLILSFLLLFAVYLFNPWAWTRILREMQEVLDYRQAFSIFYVSQLGKYVPGRVWGYISQVVLSRRAGVSGEKAFVSSILFQAISSAVTVYFFLMTLPAWDSLQGLPGILILAAASAAGAVLLQLNVLNGVSNLVLGKLFRREMRVNLSSRTILDVMGILLLSWIAYGVAYYHFMKSFYPDLDVMTGMKFTGIYAISWLIGYVSLLTPGGLGIREGVQVYLLSLFVPLPIAIVISLASRVWLTVSEIAVGAVSFCQLQRRAPSVIAPGENRDATDPAS